MIENGKGLVGSQRVIETIKGKDVAVKVMELKTIQKMGIKELFWE